MDKTAIKNFSIWARNKLIADIRYKAGLLGITEEGVKDALPQSTQDAEFYDIGTKEPYAIQREEIKQRRELVSVIRKKALQLEYKDAYRNVLEEVAYTWFNRLIAIRFMEVNDYMPAHIRVLSSESGKLEPDLVTAPFDAEIEFTQQETEHILQLKNDNQVDALFRFLFIKQCNGLNGYLPKLFEKTSDYTELLLNVSVTDQDGIVYHLIHDIAESDFNISNLGADGKPTGQVEIIGWMYQYYNTEPKDETFALLKKNVKITKERIPAATQLFTPDWIVRYMIENSVGRLWLEGHEDEELKKQWIYYLNEAEQEVDVEQQLKMIREEYKNTKPEEIKIIDPCMGSGHILVYAFDVLMQIYESYGYSRRDAAKSIVENSIYGLDIDDRAFQLAYFAIMMKARSYNRRFLTLGIEPNLCAIQESNGIQYDKEMGDFLLREEHRETLQYLLHTFVDAKEYGSILNVEMRDYDGFLKAWEQTAEATLENVIMIGWYNECNQIVPTLAKQAKILSQKYDIVVTNPPYMGISNGNEKLNKYVKKNYPDSKSDLFAVFIVRCGEMLCKNGYQAMITQHAWMFLSSFEKLRAKLQMIDTVNMAHLGARAFEEIGGEVVQTTSFVMRKSHVEEYKGVYCRLIEPTTQKGKEEMFLAGENRYMAVQDNFTKIPGSPVAYWVHSNAIKDFYTFLPLSSVSEVTRGLTTGNNDLYLRMWYEVCFDDISLCSKSVEDSAKSGCKWFPHNKGGEFRTWYGNNDLVVMFYNAGEALKKYYKINKAVRFTGIAFYFHPGITWSSLTTGKNSFRYSNMHIFDSNKGPMLFSEDDNLLYILAFLNSCVTQYFINILNPSLSLQNADMNNLPFEKCNENMLEVNVLSEHNVEICRHDWDSFETSWDFQQHPLVALSLKSKERANEGKWQYRVEDAFFWWANECETHFSELKSNEEELNRIFIDIYGLQDELTPEVADKDITVRKADLGRDIRSFISYAVGCMFGRYSLDQAGLMFAGGDMADIYTYYGGTFADTANLRLDGKYTFGELGTPFYYLPVEGKEPLECWKIDADNIIPITDEEYFTDDVVNRFTEFVKTIYGEETLEENLDFIAQALGNKGNSSREVIRNYFLKDFYADHLKVYQKRPIYWLFDSGKRNGFKALIYMHRYNADTIGNLRVDYLHRMERIYESEMERMQDMIDNSGNAREVAAATKRKEKLQKQLKECQEYDEKIGHLALSRIEIDLDDGVKVNYEKVQTARDGKKYQVLAKI
ncbi:BREX-1 system adenine-specific DNA-methyltransferase PglX [Petralouisia muris]|uniref:BREX-1 system adenine-specific DNA-methyltransferase PglX n=1 Tax=Petralouisia muris TaxID=3032872 RepID=A0AC61S1Q9_9FIRM|nr:BREX-1 system adenine-specific DNA-methyltransferase PglX [Petralouisia muris]TGY98247.1 BREX-1 system adenine-specific DNA-methyltransferase PglX [Petralouisia muris]